MTGQLSPINLQEFDVFYSAASWYRDYVAHCGIAEDAAPDSALAHHR